MVPPMRTDTLERSRDATRQRILNAAANLFSRDGFDATTVKDIARECRLTDPALYYHFPSKREILSALLVAPPLNRLEIRSVADPTYDTLVDDVCGLFDFWSDHVALLRLLYREGLEGDPEMQAFGVELEAAVQQLFVPAVEAIYGPAAPRMFSVIGALIVGLQLDALLEFGDGYRAGVSSPDFKRRLRSLVTAALPPPGPMEVT